MKNRELARELRKIADIMEIRKVRWKPEAYRAAARRIENTDTDIEKLYKKSGKKGLRKLPSIGKRLAEHLAEYLGTGKVRKWEKLRKRVPEELTELMKIGGLGPSKIRELSAELDIRDAGDLREAAEHGKLRELEGFGKKTEANILRSLRRYGKGRERMLIKEAWETAHEIIARLEENAGVEKIAYAGSLRRMKETVGDIDILAVTTHPSKILDAFTGMKDVSDVLLRGETRSTVILRGSVQTDLRIVGADSYGSAMLYFTGSRDHNIRLRKIAMEKDLKLSEYGLFEGSSDKRIAGREEADVYQKLGLAWIPPELRENRGEIAAAKQGKLPALVELKDIRGDLHMHTRYSDGLDTIREMAKKAGALGYEYLAVSDHSRSVRIANGMHTDELKKQWEAIDAIGDSESISILKGAEVDILPDGSLDYEDAVLEALDIVIAAVHSGFASGKEAMTERILRALDNAHVDILAHPSGRMINKRRGYEADFDRIFRKCGARRVALEINCNPRRLDVNDRMIMSAKEHGVRFSLGTDAHSSVMLENMRFGVGQARRGWLEKKDLLNTLSLKRLRAYLSE